MPIDYSKYPSNWKQIRQRILKREEHRCKLCNVKNYAVGFRINGEFIPTKGNIEHDAAGAGNLSYSEAINLAQHYNYWSEPPIKLIVIVLTIAHLDNDEENHDVKDERLAALCQQCHFRYDSENNVNRKAIKKYKDSIFPLN